MFVSNPNIANPQDRTTVKENVAEEPFIKCEYSKSPSSRLTARNSMTLLLMAWPDYIDHRTNAAHGTMCKEKSVLLAPKDPASWPPTNFTELFDYQSPDDKKKNVLTTRLFPKTTETTKMQITSLEHIYFQELSFHNYVEGVVKGEIEYSNKDFVTHCQNDLDGKHDNEEEESAANTSDKIPAEKELLSDVENDDDAMSAMAALSNDYTPLSNLTPQKRSHYLSAIYKSAAPFIKKIEFDQAALEKSKSGKDLNWRALRDLGRQLRLTASQDNKPPKKKQKKKK